MKTTKLLIAICLCSVLVSCNNSLSQMAKRAHEVTISCEPQVLSLAIDKVNAKLSVNIPTDYFNPKVIVEATPVLVYEGGETAAPTVIYQGEKIQQNYKTVPAAGGVFTENVSFDWVEGMQVSSLEIRAIAKCGDKQLALPVVKVADGVSTIIQFALLDGFCDYKADNYQDVLHTTVETGIHYDVNSAALKKKELNSKSVDAYRIELAQLQENPRYSVAGTEIVSYTSPEGGKDYNDKLSGKRSETAQKAWATIGQGMEANNVEVKSVGQDWDGFKTAVEASQVKDKELILRVLSMYSDPAVRESEIRNLSQVFTELKKDVLPQLRRSSFVTTLDFQNYSEQEIEAIADKALSSLDEEAILRLASIIEDSGRKASLYNYAYSRFSSKRAAFNLAALSYKDGKIAESELYLNKLADEKDPDVINLRGLIEMQNGNVAKAEDLFEKANTELSKANLGVLYIRQGEYAKAAKVLPDSDLNKPVACLLAGQNPQARASLDGKDARSEYLLAVVAAREGKVDEAKQHIAAASVYESFAARAAKDIEFAKCR